MYDLQASARTCFFRRKPTFFPGTEHRSASGGNHACLRTRQLETLFLQHANPANAGLMKRYMRHQLNMWVSRTAVLRLVAAGTSPPRAAVADGVDRLPGICALPQREFQYAATSLIGRLENTLPTGFIRTLEYLMVTKSWWDTVDTIATGSLGVHFRRFPQVRTRSLARWRRSRNFWLRRACILFQLNYKQETDFELLKDIIRENLGSDEFFINKAIGWSLRQHTRLDPQAVRQFARDTPLHPLSAREALKWVDKHGR
jgi:3-methyladenine DNA glycosylase AlkD